MRKNTGQRAVASPRVMMDIKLAAYGRWAGSVTDAGDFGNSPMTKIEQIGLAGISSFGTAYLDRSSDAMHIPERYAVTHACVEMLPERFARILNAAYKYRPRSVSSQQALMLRARYANLSVPAFIELREELITSMIQIEGFLFG